jgi:site-specific DNA-methyltransferase (adenine-specific)
MTVYLQLDQAKPSLVWESKDNLSCLYHGDSLDLMASLPSNSIDCIWADPPYNLSNDGITCVSGRMVKVNKGEWDRSQGFELDHEFNKAWLAACYRILKPTGTIWVTGTLHIYPSVGCAMQQLGFRILNDIIWEKPAPPPNLGCRCFTHSTEVIFWATKARKGKEHYIFNYEAMKVENGGKQMKNVWRMSAPSKDEKLYGKHPTQKPIALVSRCLRASTNLGDLVFDPFAGSCTTGVTALALNRRFIGCEINLCYIDISIQRLVNLPKLT